MPLRLTGRRPRKGTNAAALRNWGIVFMTAGIIGQSVLRNGLLNLNNITTEELLAAMEANPAVMALVGGAIFCQVLETCAVPIFAFLLVEGFRRTTDFVKYVLRVLGLALVSELPYNFAMSGKLLDFSGRNPVFALVIGLVMLRFFYNYSGEKSVKNTFVKLLIFVAAFAWCLMLRIDHGICMVIFVAFLWHVREKGNFRALYGFCGAMVCTIFNMYYLGACLSCILLHRYDEEKGDQNRIFNYACYPALLLVMGLAAKFL